MRKKRRQQITQGQTFYVRGTKDTVFMSVSEMNKKKVEKEREEGSKTPSLLDFFRLLPLLEEKYCIAILLFRLLLES